MAVGDGPVTVAGSSTTDVTVVEGGDPVGPWASRWSARSPVGPALGLVAGFGLVAVGSLHDVAPTGVVGWDRFLAAAFVAAVVASAMVVARPLLLTMLVFVIVTTPWWWAVAAAGALVVLAFDDRRPSVRLIVGAVGGHGLLAVDLDRALGSMVDVFFGAESVTVGVVVTALVVAAVDTRDRVVRRRLARLATAVAVAAAVATAGAGYAASRATDPALDGIEALRLGRDAAIEGDAEAVEVHLVTARDRFAAAEAELTAWWARPGRLVPIVGHHVAVAQVIAGRAAAVVDAALATVEPAAALDEAHGSDEPGSDAPGSEASGSGGTFELELVEALQEPLALLDAELAATVTALAEVRSPWLVPPVAERVSAGADELGRAHRTTAMTASAARLVPGLLGADGPRRYLVLFATPAEAREAGGIVGNVVELTARNGRLSITAARRDRELNAAGPGELTGLDAYPPRFLLGEPERYAQNWTGVVDFPAVAAAVADLYPTMGGRPIDGVIYADPHALAALLELTGPVSVEGVDRPIGPDQVAHFLLVEQYLAFDKPDREDFLDRISAVTFARLLAAEVPSPRRLVEILGPAARHGRLRIATFDPEANELLEQASLLGRFGAIEGSDVFRVVHVNGEPNKLDAYLHRRVIYRAAVEPDTGSIEATATIVLDNDVVVGDLPAYVVGGDDRDVEPGVNRVELSIYTPHGLDRAEVDGAEVGVEPQVEHGLNRYRVVVDVPPGSTSRVVFHLEGTFDGAGGAYRLAVPAQPVANPDELTVDVEVGAERFIETVTHVETLIVESGAGGP